MKRCPVCHGTWADENLICMFDSNLLDVVDEAEAAALEASSGAAAALAPAPERRRPRGVGSLVSEAVDALETQRARDRDAIRARMRQLAKYNTYCHAVWRFVTELSGESEQFSYEIHDAADDDGMRKTYTLTIGHDRYERSFPIRAAYQRTLGYDVTLEIDLGQIGLTPEERAARTDELGGRTTSTRFGWSHTLRVPREIDDEDGVIAWLEDAFRGVFRLAYGADIAA